MIGKFSGLGEDLMPWVEIADSDLHGNDRNRPANEKERGTHFYFQSHASSSKVEVEVVDVIP
jgi:hypothetical protein